ncbi:parallel beta-helix domain-containing protein [Ferrimonas balearica]|uniref:parallel beta-helix domain-containing protein n=1 Tax=Ferrimonas balearica TaxID=44012 RepID=UPI001C971EF5|nr:parallel beta-helix domain-containing protein [Ferrimonas balearica]MBY6225503.1 right-handed parallel beta-helix repeat-containing protein [Ferrimonas balearica]
MREKRSWLLPTLLASAVALNLAGCGSDDETVTVTPPPPTTTPPEPEGPTFPEGAIMVEVGENLGANITEAFINAQSGDVIVLPEGKFKLDRTLLFDGDADGDGVFAKNVTIMGYGQDKTILDFSEAASGDGIFVQNAVNITIQDLSVNEAKNNGIKLKNSNGIILRRLATIWAGELNEENGAYGLYPVECQNILIEDTYVRGSADAGIYVGQSEYIVVRRNVAIENVAGIEIENSKYADVYDNHAVANTGGILVFDLPIGNHRYGSSVRIFDNLVEGNNTKNFANASANPAGVHIVPPGTGIIILSTDDVEIFNNVIRDHDTLSITASSFFIAEPDVTGAFAMNYAQPGGIIDDGWRAVPRNIHIHSNEITNSGSNPNGYLIEDIIGAYTQIHGVFPAILYDGLGEAVANSGLFAGPSAMIDYKEPPFAADGSDNVCVSNNGDVSLGQLYAGDHSPATLEVPDILFESSQNKLMNCTQVSLPVHTVTIGDEVFGCGIDDDTAGCDGGETVGNGGSIGEGEGGLVGDGDLSLCEASGSEVNWSALLGANCANLSDYNLFADSANPKGAANSGGMPYDLNSPLFTDYTSKYRYVFVPGGEAAAYDAQEVFDFPVGTVLVKTFAMPDNTATPGNENEEILETRLLIHREAGWSALPYVWNANKDEAVLAKPGSIMNQSVVHKGETIEFDYVVPSLNQCKQCHQYSGEDGIARFMPIGPKARHLNGNYEYADGSANQLTAWTAHGILTGAPADLASIPTVPAFELLGNGDLSGATDAEVMDLAKGYLDINCAHCHRPEGNASNTGLKLEYWRPYEGNEQAHGECKSPVAYGGGSLGYDIVPGNPDESITHFRMAATEPGDRMPEIGRSLAHDAGVDLIREWITRLPAATCSQ